MNSYMTTDNSFFFIVVVYEVKDQSTNNAECQDDADQHATYSDPHLRIAV